MNFLYNIYTLAKKYGILSYIVSDRSFAINNEQ